MKQIFLASQFYVVGGSIATKIPQASKQKTVFITTPIKYRVFTDQELDWHYKNRATLKDNGFICTDYDIAGKSEEEIKHDLDQYEVMYVEGGNPFYVLQESQKNNFGEYVKKRISTGMFYVSESAGSVIAGADIAANSRPGKRASDYDLKNTTGFNLVNFVILPHWGAVSKKEDYLSHKIPQSYTENFPYLLLGNTQYVEVEGEYFKIIDVKYK